MKTLSIVACTAFIICTAFIKPATDYRDTYVGNYFCNRACQVSKLEGGGTNSITDTLTIGISKAALDSILKITIGQNYQVKLKNGIMYPYPSGAHRGGKFFSTDSISFILSTSQMAVCGYRGKKK